jgi:hypothetical protein
MAKAQSDKFANMAYIQVVESALNTLTFKKLETGVSLFEKVAWLIEKIEYQVEAATWALFNATADYLNLALCASNQMSLLKLDNPAVFDFMRITRVDLGAAASGAWHFSPITRDFTGLSGGGLLIPPNPIYLAAHGSGLTGPVTIETRIYYTTYELSPDEYWELVESRRIISSS